MEYGSNREDDHRQADFHQVYGSSRDWFSVDKFITATDESSEHMDASPPATNESDYYSHEKINVGSFSDQRKQMQEHQTLGLGIIGGQICSIEREHMFDKVVTPSDVGKLNRLVIPKQHAEKHFPLDSSSNEKGLLLNFEDLTGKSWRFRYSYWNSSQSYVMTKGWSRFVKEKKLDAGDTVSFKRGVGQAEKHRLFIDWRRRPITTPPPVYSQFYRSPAGGGSGIPSWSPMLFRPPPNRVHPTFNFQTTHDHHQSNNNYCGGGNYMGHQVYLTSPEGIGTMVPGIGERVVPVVFESVPVVQEGRKRVAAVAKKLRLFGVNMDCPISSDTSTSDEYEILASSPTAHDLNL